MSCITQTGWRMALKRDEQGRLHFEAAAPGQVAPQTVSGAIVARPGVASGNPNFDPASGRFAGPGTSQQPPGSTPINRAATGQPDNGLASVVNDYIGLITSRFAEATSMAIYPNTEGTATVVLFNQNGERLTVFSVPNAQADQATLDKFTEEIVKPAQERAAQDRVANLTRSSVPAGVSPDDWAHHQDVIREAARTMPNIDLGTANQFLHDHNAGDVSAEQFIKDVREQQIDDLADVLSQQLHGKIEQIKRARQTVRVTAPAGWTKNVFAGLDDNEVLKLLTRLEGKGWDPEDIKKHVIGRMQNTERAAKIAQLFGEKKPRSGKKQPKRGVAAEDVFEPTPEAVLLELREDVPKPPAPEPINLAEEMTKLAQALPQPVHNVYVNMPEQKRMRRRTIRDDNNLIVEVIEEPVEQ